MHYEQWLNRGRPNDGMELAALPREYQLLIERWPDAFEFFRHSMFAYLSHVLRMRPVDALLRSLWRRTEMKDPSGAGEVLESAWHAVERYRDQRRNAWGEILDSVDRTADDATNVRAYLRAYLVAFEMDLPLWFLGVLGRGFRQGHFAADAFGGPETKTPQGALVNQVGTVLRPTPLGPLFASAYDADLRNAAGHNDYQLRKADDGLLVTDRGSGLSWSVEQIADKVERVWAIIHAVEHGIQFLYQARAVQSRFVPTDYGVLTTSHAIQDDYPYIVVAQLWCFRDLDPPGDWLDRAEISWSSEPRGQQRLTLSPSAFSIGQPLNSRVVDAMRNVGWVRVARVPIAPDLGLGHPTYEIPGGGLGSYAVVGPTDEHVVPVANALRRADDGE